MNRYQNNGGRNAPTRWRPEEPPPDRPLPVVRESFTACAKRRMKMTKDERDREPARTYMEIMTDRMIDKATSDDRNAMTAAKVIIAYTDGKPAQSVNHVFGGSTQTIDPDKQRVILNDPAMREHMTALEERYTELTGDELINRPAYEIEMKGTIDLIEDDDL